MEATNEVRVLDARVAQRVMGADIVIERLDDENGSRTRITHIDASGAKRTREHWNDSHDGYAAWGLGDPWPNYTTDAADDYAVLERVRETWGHSARFLFGLKLLAIWRKRGGPMSEPILRYEPGDYSRAALAVLDEGEG